MLESLDWGAIEQMLVVIGRTWTKDQGTSYKPLGLKMVISRLQVGLSGMGGKRLLSCPVAGHTVHLGRDILNVLPLTPDSGILNVLPLAPDSILPSHQVHGAFIQATCPIFPGNSFSCPDCRMRIVDSGP